MSPIPHDLCANHLWHNRATMMKVTLPKDLVELTNLVKQVAREELLPRFNRVSRQYKRDGSPLTEADLACHHCLEDRLARIWPETGFLSEELDSSQQQEILELHRNGVWVVDPLDGTTNFIHGAFPFSISVGLAEGDTVVCGIVYEFGRDETFYAWKDGGAWLDGKSIRVSQTGTVSQSLIATGWRSNG